MNIQFDENLNPVEINKDYLLLKEIFTDPEVMKTSTAFAGGLAENDYDLHTFMNALLEKDESFRKDYGFQKIRHKALNEYVGVMGLMRNTENIVEGGIFLKSKYIGSGIGFWAEKCLFANLERLNGIMIASAWEENKVAIKLMLKNGMNFVNQIQKSYNNNNMVVNIYIKFSNKYEQHNIVCVENYLIASKLSKVAHVK